MTKRGTSGKSHRWAAAAVVIGASPALLTACGGNGRALDATSAGDGPIDDSVTAEVVAPDITSPDIDGSDDAPGAPADVAVSEDADTTAADSLTNDTSSGTDVVGGPILTAVSPASTSFRGGATLTLEGAALSPAPSVQVGGHAATIITASDSQVVVTAPPSPTGGPTPVTLTTALGTATFDHFSYDGLPPPLLRWVEVPGQVDLVQASALFAIRGATAPRLLALGPSGLYVLDATDGRLAVAWSDPNAPIALAAACVADFDGDGDDDLWLADSTNGVGIHRQDAAGLSSPTLEPGLPVTRALCGDVTGDGNADVLIAVAPVGGQPALQILVGNGIGDLAAASGGITLGGTPKGLAAGDVNGDGHGDVLVGRSTGAPRLLLGDGFGGFADAPSGSTPATGSGALPALGDLNGDGHLDAFLLGKGGPAVWVNDGAGKLIDSAGLAVGIAGFEADQITLVDLDVDGTLDVFASGAGQVALLRNDGSGRLFDYTDAWLPRPGPAVTGAAVLDADGDLDPDIVALRGAAGPTLLQAWDPAPWLDPDYDGIPTELDVCPADADPDQKNSDVLHFRCADADACLAETGCTLSVAPTGRAYLYCPSKKVSEAAAIAYCRSRSAEPLFLNDEGEQTYVATLGTEHVWLDLTDAGHEGTFVSSAEVAPPFTAWGTNQPDNAGGAENCIELIPADPTAGLLWNDLPCDLPRALVCEDVIAEALPDPADACDNCPLVQNPDQKDTDGDGLGDACEAAP